MVGPAPPPLGGVTVLFASLVRGLESRDDVEVEVVDTKGVRGHGLAGLVALARLSSRVGRAARRADVIALHAATSGLHVTGTIAASAARAAGRPLIVRKFGGTDFTRYSWLRRRLIERALERSALYLSETRGLVEVGRRLGLPAEWYPNSREMPPLPPPDGSESCRRFVYLGHVRREKGIGELIAAADGLPDGVSVDVYGTLGFDVDEQELVDKAGLRYRGALAPEDVHDVLSGYDALVLPSYREGYPGVVLEAFAAGLPVIVSGLPSIREMVDETCGVLIEPRDPSDLRDAMTRLSREPEEYRTLLAGVRARREDFSNAVWHERFVAYCRAALEGTVRQTESAYGL
jgi:glycosyltransferase involved in cell wall biosynthesis